MSRSRLSGGLPYRPFCTLASASRYISSSIGIFCNSDRRETRSSARSRISPKRWQSSRNRCIRICVLSPSRPALEQVEETIEQLPVRMSEELVTDIAELGGVAPQWLRRFGCGTRLLQGVRGVAAHLAEHPEVLAQPLALIGARRVVLEERVMTHGRIERVGENAHAFLGRFHQLVALEIELRAIGERLGEERGHGGEHVADLLGRRLSRAGGGGGPGGQAR